ncbi:MAG: TGS domain-containing protein, partial [Burkholderiales bacterium]
KVISLPRGSTPIDFAYAVHSDVGNRCRGAKVDGHIVPLATSLQNGQRVEILTVKEGGPSINWLHDGLVKSSKAISHIRRYIRNQNLEEFLAAGTEIFERELAKFPSSVRPLLSEIVAKLGYDNDKNICIDLGRGDLSPTAVRDAINKLIAKANEPTQTADLTSELASGSLDFVPITTTKYVAKQAVGVLVDGVSGIVTYIAKCCKPLPGDDIIGFISQGHGVAVHRRSCSGIKRQAKLAPNKIVDVEWGSDVKQAFFNADIEVVANDRSGLLRDLTDLFAREKLSIAGLRTVCKHNRAFMVFTLQVSGGEFNFPWLISKLFAVSGVIEVARK